MYRFFAVTFGLGWALQALSPTSYFWLAATMWTPALGALAEGFRPPPYVLTGGQRVPYWGSMWPAGLWTLLTVAFTLPLHRAEPRAEALLAFLLAPLTPVAVAFLGAFGEEYGWRGYLLPRLAERWGYLKASFVVGLIWALWHTPAILLGYEYGWRWRAEGVLLFILPTVPLSVIHTAVYLRYGVWGAAFLHGAVNSWAPLYYLLFPQLLEERWLWGPVGIQGAALLLPVAIAAWRKYVAETHAGQPNPQRRGES
ncbi:MAG: CPBP family intramembrane glutamic endopeptidase [Pyrobaculum sp.]